MVFILITSTFQKQKLKSNRHKAKQRDICDQKTCDQKKTFATNLDLKLKMLNLCNRFNIRLLQTKETPSCEYEPRVAGGA